MTGVIQFTLERDGHNQPWGFRLQGGHDVGLPLTVQRVLVGTPSEGVLRKGDILCKVSTTDAKNLSHQRAADLFTKAGNQITIFIKRPGVAGDPLPVTSVIEAAHRPTPEKLLMNLIKPRNQPKPFTTSTHQASSTSSSPLSLTIQNQPYRTSPLIQPSAKISVDIGPGSTSHLKMQAEYIVGTKEPQGLYENQNAKATQFVMQQKVTGTLQQIQNTSGSNPIPIDHQRSTPITGSPVQASMQPSQSKPTTKQFYNNPINLYSNANVNEVAKLNTMGLSGDALGGVASPASPTGLINPVNKPVKFSRMLGGLPQTYDPEQSATWQVIDELENCRLITEHGPESSKVYSI